MKSWNELLAHEVRDLHDAELKMIEVLPELVRFAGAPQLKGAFEEHLAETQMHVERLERVAEILEVELGNITSAGMEVRLEDGIGILKDKVRPADVPDAALIGAAHKVETFKRMSYEAAIDHAGMLGHEEVVELLRRTLDEEVAAGDKLAAVWEGMAGSEALVPELAMA